MGQWMEQVAKEIVSQPSATPDPANQERLEKAVDELLDTVEQH